MKFKTIKEFLQWLVKDYENCPAVFYFTFEADTLTVETASNIKDLFSEGVSYRWIDTLYGVFNTLENEHILKLSSDRDWNIALTIDEYLRFDIPYKLTVYEDEATEELQVIEL